MKLIPNFENYSITMSGRVINNITKKVKKPSDNHSGKGYLFVDLYCNGNRKRFYIHRLVAKLYIPNPENKPYVNHIDGNPKNNNCENLEWVTAKENTLRSVANGLKPRGERHRNHKLTQENVYEIRRLYKTGDYTYSKIAEVFKVSKTVIRDIIKNKTWADDNVKFDRKECEGV